MIPITLACMALAAAVTIYHAANVSSIQIALQLAVMLGIGLVAGLLLASHHVNRHD